MTPQQWKLEVSIRDPKNPIILLTSLTDNGMYIQTSGLVKETEGLKSFVQKHVDAVNDYHLAYHEQAHQLAVQAAKEQAARYSQKGENG